MANFLYALYLTSCLLANFEYGSLGDLLSRTEADRSLHFFYDNERQLRTVRNERDEFYRFTRDGNGAVIKEQGEVGLVHFLYQGQYLDGEPGLAYNRFRYYSPETGAYISQDPIRLEAGLTNLYAYVHDVNAWVDPWGLRSFTQAVGDIGEKYAQDLLKKQGFDLVDVKYGSNNGIDILANLKVMHVTIQRGAKGRL